MAAETTSLSDKITNILTESGYDAGQIARKLFGPEGHPSMVTRILNKMKREGKIQKSGKIWRRVEDLGLDGFLQKLSLDIDEILREKWLASPEVGYALSREQLGSSLMNDHKLSSNSLIIDQALDLSLSRGKITQFCDLRIDATTYYVISEKQKMTDSFSIEKKLQEILNENEGWMPTKNLIKLFKPQNKFQYKNYRRLINGILYKMLETGQVENEFDTNGKRPKWRFVTKTQ